MSRATPIVGWRISSACMVLQPAMLPGLTSARLATRSAPLVAIGSGWRRRRPAPTSHALRSQRSVRGQPDWHREASRPPLGRASAVDAAPSHLPPGAGQVVRESAPPMHCSQRTLHVQTTRWIARIRDQVCRHTTQEMIDDSPRRGLVERRAHMGRGPSA
jgi:hypothetical protein